MTAASDLKSNSTPDSGLRIGECQVDGTTGAITVTVNGVTVDCGYLDPYTWGDGSAVALTRYKSTWLALGTISDGARPQHIGDTVVTVDSATIVAETIIVSLTVFLVAGRRYRVWSTMHVGSTTATDVAAIRMREDSVAGTAINFTDSWVAAAIGATTGPPVNLIGEYTAVATGSKTFVLTLERVSGAGNIRLEAFTNRPAILSVEYLSG